MGQIPESDAPMQSFEPRDFGVLDGQLSFYIRLMETAVTRHLDARLRDHLFSKRKGTITAITMISRHPGLRSTTIATRLKMDKSIVAKILDDLVRHGMVEKHQSPDDKRAYELFVTLKGLQAAQELEELVIHHSRDFFDALMTREEHDLVVGILRRAFGRLKEKE